MTKIITFSLQRVSSCLQVFFLGSKSVSCILSIISCLSIGQHHKFCCQWPRQIDKSRNFSQAAVAKLWHYQFCVRFQICNGATKTCAWLLSCHTEKKDCKDFFFWCFFSITGVNRTNRNSTPYSQLNYSHFYKIVLCLIARKLWSLIFTSVIIIICPSRWLYTPLYVMFFFQAFLVFIQHLIILSSNTICNFLHNSVIALLRCFLWTTDKTTNA